MVGDGLALWSTLENNEAAAIESIKFAGASGVLDTIDLLGWATMVPGERAVTLSTAALDLGAAAVGFGELRYCGQNPGVCSS